MINKMTDERLSEIRERAEKATEGPWLHTQPEFRDHTSQTIRAHDQVVAFAGYGLATTEPWRNAEFIAHARQDVPDLFAEVERLRGEVERLESSKLLAASMMAEQFCGEQVERLRRQVATLRAERAKGHRYYVAAYRARNGGITLFGNEVMDRDYAEREAIELSSDDDATPMFVATRVVPPWVPVTEEGPTP